MPDSESADPAESHQGTLSGVIGCCAVLYRFDRRALHRNACRLGRSVSSEIGVKNESELLARLH